MAELRQHLNVSQRQQQVIQPAMLQLVKFLLLNRLELKEALAEEMKENPALEEQEPSGMTEGEETDARRDVSAERIAADSQEPSLATKDAPENPFDDIDFSAWDAYLDTGYRSPREMETIELPAFENNLTRPANLTDHLEWQLGSLPLRPEVRAAAEEVIGNLDENGRLSATEDEMLGIASVEKPEPVAATSPHQPFDLASAITDEIPVRSILAQDRPALAAPAASAPTRGFSREDLREAIALVQSLDPTGVGARDLRECLLLQLAARRRAQGLAGDADSVLDDATIMVEQHWEHLQQSKFKETAKAMGRSVEAIMVARELIRKLDPMPGLRYNSSEARVIEPDVDIVKIGSEYVLLMNDDDVPQLRINPAYRRLMTKDADKDTRTYLKDKYRSAEQLIKNIEQRKQTILRVCHCVVERQRDFLDLGLDHLRPMMIKEVAEEIGVHPSTVSRAVDGKYVHTPQGVFELRYFFSESVGGEMGGTIPLVVLKRMVKKMIDEEDSAQPLTDEQICDMLTAKGVSVTRRTVAKYREDMRIPSTHQRRRKP